MRKLSIAAFLLALIMIFTGCNLIVLNEERDMQKTVIVVDGQKITKEDYANAYYNALQRFVYTYGYSFDPDNIKQYALDDVVNNKILEIKAEEYGCYNFTPEELEELDSKFNTYIDGLRGTSRGQIENNEEYANLSQEELDKLIEEAFQTKLEEINFDEAAYKQTLKDQKAINKIINIITEMEDPTEDELLSAFNEKVEEQKASFLQDPSSYESQAINGSTIYYNLPDSRQALHVLIGFPEEIQSQVDALREKGDDATADFLYNQQFAILQDEAETVYQLALEGTNFDQLIAEYGDDPGMDQGYYYTVVKGSQTFAPEFVEGLFSLENVGDFTPPIATEFGYHIILYAQEVPEGPVPFDDLKEEINNELISNKQNALYSAQMEEWKADMKIKIHESRLEFVNE